MEMRGQFWMFDFGERLDCRVKEDKWIVNMSLL